MKLKLKNIERKTFIFLTTVPILAMYFLFYIYPSLRGLYMSLFSWRGLSLKAMNFIGIENFVRLFQDKVFYQALYNNLYIFIFASLITFALAFFFASLLARDVLKEKNFYRTIFFFPVAVPMVVVGIIAISVYQQVGIINTLLEAVGLEEWQQLWFADRLLVKPSLTSFLIWKVLGFYMILNLAGILNIPRELYESAVIDGANAFQQTIKITLPLIWEVVRIQLVFFIISSFTAVFELVFSTTEGGPDRASEVLVTYMYEMGFKNYQFGYGASIGVVILIITTLMALLLLRVSKRETVQL
jgi:N-acetylglucosamine transport system permease protein